MAALSCSQPPCHRPLHVTFDCEIMYTWVGEPDRTRLPQVYSIDYFRHWSSPE